MPDDGGDENGVIQFNPHRRIIENLSDIPEAELARVARAEVIETWYSRLLNARRAMRPKMTQERLEEISGVKRSLIGAYETGAVKEPKPGVLDRLCRALGITVESLGVEETANMAPRGSAAAPAGPAAKLSAVNMIRAVLRDVRALERRIEDWLDQNPSD